MMDKTDVYENEGAYRLRTMKILLFEPNAEASDRLVFSLEGSFKANVRSLTTLEDVLDAVHTRENQFDLLILDLSEQDKSPKLLSEIQKLSANTPCVLCVSESNVADSLKWKTQILIDKSNLLNNVIKSIEQVVQNPAARSQDIDQKYCKIQTKLLVAVGKLKGDVFIRLSDHKYIKLFNEGDEFEHSDLEKYTLKKGVEYLYLHVDDVNEFIDKYNADLNAKLAEMNKNPPKNVVETVVAAHETTRELGKRVGFSKDVQVMAKAAVQMTMKEMGKNPGLRDILNRLEGHKDDYIGAHSMLCGMTACAIASHLEWGSEQTFNKLTLAAFLHDITFDNQRLAACGTIEEVASGGFTTNELNQYKQHPGAAARIAQQFREVPPDVDQIIIQHHELPDGSGFPRKLNHTHMAPLTAVFLVAHDMADWIFKCGADNFVVADFLESVKSKYTYSVFRKVIEAVSHL